MPKKTDEQEDRVKKHPNVKARQAPNNYEAECSLLGSMLIDGRTAARYIPRLTRADFYTPANKCVFAAQYELFTSGKAIDLVTVTAELEKEGTIAKAGGVEYLAKLVNDMPSVANAEYYYENVKKPSTLRSVIDIATRMADEAYAYEPDKEVIERAESKLFKLAEQNAKGKPELIAGLVAPVLEEIRERALSSNIYRGVPTGFSKLDMILGGGFQNSDLIILAARPGQGKTTFAMNCAVNAALRKKPDGSPISVAVFSLEMSKKQLVRRILCSQSGYDMSRANRGLINENEWSKLYEADERLKHIKLYIDETGAITPSEILSKCRELKRTVGLDFVMIDYLQLMQSGRHLDNFVREIAEITRSLKLAAKELDVPVLLLSQMSRSIEQRKGKDKESRLSDLRDSGAIEQDADIVLFIDKKETGEEGNAREYSKAASVDVYINIAKHRNGETGNVKLRWHPSTVSFSDDNSSIDPNDYRASRTSPPPAAQDPPPPEEDPYDSGLLEDEDE